MTGNLLLYGSHYYTSHQYRKKSRFVVTC